VVAAAHGEEAGRDLVVPELRGEADVLRPKLVVAARVHPHVRPARAQPTCDRRELLIGAVPREEAAVVAEDRGDVVGALVARPALEDAECAGVVEADVERPVAALAQPAERPLGPGRDRPEALVDRADDVTRDERLPALVRPSPVRPFFVRERPR